MPEFPVECRVSPQDLWDGGLRKPQNAPETYNAISHSGVFLNEGELCFTEEANGVEPDQDDNVQPESNNQHKYITRRNEEHLLAGKDLKFDVTFPWTKTSYNNYKFSQDYN